MMIYAVGFARYADDVVRLDGLARSDVGESHGVLRDFLRHLVHRAEGALSLARRQYGERPPVPRALLTRRAMRDRQATVAVLGDEVIMRLDGDFLHDYRVVANRSRETPLAVGGLALRRFPLLLVELLDVLLRLVREFALRLAHCVSTVERDQQHEYGDYHPRQTVLVETAFA